MKAFGATLMAAELLRDGGSLPFAGAACFGRSSGAERQSVVPCCGLVELLVSRLYDGIRSRSASSGAPMATLRSRPAAASSEVDGAAVEGWQPLKPRTLVDMVIEALIAGVARGLILPGDRVQVELTPYDLSRGRITYRYK